MNLPILAQDIPEVLPKLIEAIILGDSFYSDVPVVIIDPTDTEQNILEKTGVLLTKSGACGVVLFILPISVVAEDDYKNPATGPLRLHVEFQVWEMLQRKEISTGNTKSAYKIARHTFALMKNRTFGGVAKEFVSAAPVIELVPPPAGARLRGWQVNFSAREDDYTVVPRLNLPSFTPPKGVATTVVMANSNGDAQIYFTTDGSPPGENNLGTQGDNLIAGDAIFNDGGIFAVHMDSGARYIIYDPSGIATSIIGMGGDYNFTGTPGALVPQKVFVAAAQVYFNPVPVPDAGFTLFAAAYVDGFFPSSMISSTFTKA